MSVFFAKVVEKIRYNLIVILATKTTKRNIIIFGEIAQILTIVNGNTPKA